MKVVAIKKLQRNGVRFTDATETRQTMEDFRQSARVYDKAINVNALELIQRQRTEYDTKIRCFRYNENVSESMGHGNLVTDNTQLGS